MPGDVCLAAPRPLIAPRVLGAELARSDLQPGEPSLEHDASRQLPVPATLGRAQARWMLPRQSLRRPLRVPCDCDALFKPRLLCPCSTESHLLEFDRAPIPDAGDKSWRRAVRASPGKGEVRKQHSSFYVALFARPAWSGISSSVNVLASLAAA